MGQILDAMEEGIHSEGLRSLQEEIGRARRDPVYQNLVRELPVMLSRLQSSASITIGVNLDGRLRPVQATLLSVNEKPFTEQSLLNRLFGVRTGPGRGSPPCIPSRSRSPGWMGRSTP